MPQAPKVILIAHDGCKDSLAEWAKFNRGTLSHRELVATRSTGLAVQASADLLISLPPWRKFRSVPSGAMVAAGSGAREVPGGF